MATTCDFIFRNEIHVGGGRNVNAELFILRQRLSMGPGSQMQFYASYFL